MVPDLRLPELFCGFARDEVGAPVAYPVACSPQAWAAAAPFHLLRTMLGLRADAHAHRLELVLPTLPEWLTKLTITGLPVGGDRSTSWSIAGEAGRARSCSDDAARPT